MAGAFGAVAVFSRELFLRYIKFSKLGLQFPGGPSKNRAGRAEYFCWASRLARPLLTNRESAEVQSTGLWWRSAHSPSTHSDVIADRSSIFLRCWPWLTCACLVELVVELLFYALCHVPRSRTSCSAGSVRNNSPPSRPSAANSKNCTRSM